MALPPPKQINGYKINQWLHEKLRQMQAQNDNIVHFRAFVFKTSLNCQSQVTSPLLFLIARFVLRRFFFFFFASILLLHLSCRSFHFISSVKNLSVGGGSTQRRGFSYDFRY